MINKKIYRYFWLVLFLHLLLMLSFLLKLTDTGMTPAYQKNESAMPAYIYQDDVSRPFPQTLPTPGNSPPPSSEQVLEKTTESKKQEISKEGILPEKKVIMQKKPEQISDSTSASYATPSGAIHFKSENEVDRPLLKILGKATSEKLFYPKIALDFHLTGTVSIQFLISPNGQVTEITLVQSSGNDILDHAALETLHAISPVNGVGTYLKAPQHLVVAIIYR